MPPHLQIVTAFSLIVLTAWGLLEPWHAATASLVGIGAVAAFMAVQIWSPKSQWVVPTVHRLATDQRALALTFDDGPDPAVTPRVLALLAQHGARATFFMVGRRAEQHPALVHAVHAAGHQIGSHSYHHAANFHFQSAPAMAAEIERGVAALERLTGVPPTAFRPPIGLRVPTLRPALRRVARPLVCYTWTARGLDSKHLPATAIVARLTPHLTPGAILSLHDAGGLGGSSDREPTIAALQTLLQEMQQRGIVSRRLDELMA